MAIKPSWRKLLDLGVVKRTDVGMWARPSAIRIIPGFNLRDESAPGYREDIESLKTYKRQGGKVPPIEVALSPDGQGVDVIAGHRRTAADRELIAEGLQIEWVRIEPFEGNDLERHKRLLTSQEDRKLLPVETALQYKRMKTLFGLNNEQLSAEVGKSRQHVEQMLLLANAPHAVQLMVRDKLLSATEAIEAVRTHGDDAGRVLGNAQVAAAASGKKRVTKSALREWSPPASAVRPMISAVSAVVSSIPESVRKALTDKPSGDQTITLPASVVFELISQQSAIDALRDRATKRNDQTPVPKEKAA